MNERIVRINKSAANIKSKYGKVVDEDENVVLLKVGIKNDRNLFSGDKLILGKKHISEIVKFEVGKIYYTQFVTQSDTIIKVKIVGRTEKTIKWILLDGNKKEVKTARPFIYYGVERFYPLGRYSMSPVIVANRPYLK